MDLTCSTCHGPREIVSRHPTSEGEILYARCACGLRAHLDGAPVLEAASCAS